MGNQNDSLLEGEDELLPSLAATAANLNEASKKLSRVVERIDNALQRINLGVTAWTQVRGGDVQGADRFWSEELGYSRTGRKWGLTLRKIRYDMLNPEFEKLEEWLFNEAPRSLRIRAITKIPDLLKELDREAKKLATQVSESINKTEPLVEAIEKSMHPQRSIKKKRRRRL